MSPKGVGFGQSLDSEAVPSPCTASKQGVSVPALLTAVCYAGGACRWLSLRVNAVLCPFVCATARVLAGERRRASHPLCCVPAPYVCTVLMAGGM